MKEVILINQVGVAAAGLVGRTDLVDWAIVDYLGEEYFTKRRKTVFVPGKALSFVWVNYQRMLEEMPLLGICDKGALTNRLKKLRKLGLIETFRANDNTLYFILTPKCVGALKGGRR